MRHRCSNYTRVMNSDIKLVVVWLPSELLLQCCPYFYLYLKIQQINFKLPFFLKQKQAGDGAEHEATHVRSGYSLSPDCLSLILTVFVQPWQLICGDVDSHDLTRLVPMLAERRLQTPTRLKLHSFLPIRRKPSESGIWTHQMDWSTSGYEFKPLNKVRSGMLNLFL